MFKTITILGFLLIIPISLVALTDKELAISIDLSGKERMLSQKMTKESLLIYSNINKKLNIDKLIESSQLFDKILNGLINGDKKLKLVVSKDKKIIEQLKKVQLLWQPFYKEIKLVIVGKSDDSTYQFLEKNNITLLEEINRVVDTFSSKHKENSKLKLANDINLAGKQRMLTQKMAKDLLFIKNNLNKDVYLKDLKNSQKLFIKTLNGLQHGDKSLNLVGTKLTKIVTQLKIVENLWREEEKLLKSALKGKELPKAINGLDNLLIEMNRGVILYTQSVNRQKQRLKFASLIGSFMNKTKILKKRVNISGKQRMLTQRMTKLALLVSLNINKKENIEKLLTVSKLYDKTLKAFQKGDKDLGCIPSNKEDIQKQTLVIEKKWNAFFKEVKTIAEGRDKKGTALAYVIANNEELLKLSNDLVKKFETSNQALNYLDKARLHIVNVAGRERMLTQKMTKEKLLVANGGVANLSKLEKTIQLFDDSLRALIEGNKELKIVKSSNNKIIKQLEVVATIWKELKPLYTKENLSQKELNVIIEKNPILLKEMNRMVKMAELEMEY